ncbi:MAG TPA: nucleotidyltransferase family protein, partial [Immundisolibacter sp.]|nr:nucleotidyltransferase family protein [Immundisolibacter sp.]
MTIGILLAAGAGSRFGGDKLLAPLNGTPLVLHAVAALRPAVAEIIAVVRPADKILAALLTQSGARVVVCDEAAAGMGHSLACGARQVPPDCNVLVALGDMPAVAPHTIACIIAALAAGAAIAVPCHQGRRGHPVGFAARFVPRLRELTQDRGARSILHGNVDAVQEIPIDDAGVLTDIDTVTDLEQVSRRHPEMQPGPSQSPERRGT